MESKKIELTDKECDAVKKALKYEKMNYECLIGGLKAWKEDQSLIPLREELVDTIRTIEEVEKKLG